MKAKIYHWIDEKTREEFTGSVKEYCDKYNILEPNVFYRLRKGYLTRKLVGSKGSRTYTNIETGESYHGLKKDAREYFGYSWSTLYSKLKEGLIQVDPPEDELPYGEDKISDPKTKRLLTKYYIMKINELGSLGEDNYDK